MFLVLLILWEIPFFQFIENKSYTTLFSPVIEDLKCERIDSVLLSLPPNEKSSDHEFQKHEFNDFKVS